jgi:hypothetical protein
MIVDDGNDFLTLLMFVARVTNPIAPFLATVLVPSPWSTLRSSCFSARDAVHSPQTCQSDPSSAHRAKTLNSHSGWPACLGIVRHGQTPLHSV